MKPREMALFVVGILLLVGSIALLGEVKPQSDLRGPIAVVPILGLIDILAAGYMWQGRRSL